MAFKVYIVTRCIDENMNDVRLAESFIRTTTSSKPKRTPTKGKSCIQGYKLPFKLTNLQVELRQKKLFSSQTGSTNSTVVDGDHQSCNGFTDSSSSSQFSSSIPDLSGHQPFHIITSHSKHPNFHYHCPAQNQDPTVCAKYGCSKRRQRHNHNKNTSMTDRPPLYVDNEADVEDTDGPSCFDDFDFFRPTSFEQLDEEGEDLRKALL
uniref:Uncharacterized protein n=1 Tax=Ditylenchus dipsaci TaxID=166011 RepID=A0A915DAL0_9BILA